MQQHARINRALVAAVVFVALALTFPALAHAEIAWNPAGLGTSQTNPNSGDGNWRFSWGNSRWPEITFLANDAAQGFLYRVDRSPYTVIDTSTPTAYEHSPFVAGTGLNHTFDIQGTYNYPPVGGWTNDPPPSSVIKFNPEWGIADPLEGAWYLHIVLYATDPDTGATDWSTQRTVFLGLDFTAPKAVENVRVTPNSGVTPGKNVVGASSRVTVSWDGKDYDKLAGCGYYTLFLDGKPIATGVATETASVDVYSQPPFWYDPLFTMPYNTTIEDLTPGRHTFQLCATDRATNTGPLSEEAVYWVDPDQPTISFTRPAGGSIGMTPSLAVNANDAGGVKSVQYFFDGVPIGSATAAPWGAKANLSRFSAGGHVLSAIVTDVYGHTAQASKWVTLDRKPLTISRYSRTPDPFYPILKDRYKDSSSIYYTVNKECVATLTIRKSGGEVVRTLSASVKPGRRKFVWNGKWASDGLPHKGTYYYQITATDAAGYTATTRTLKTRINNYELKKIGRGKVRVIQR